MFPVQIVSLCFVLVMALDFSVSSILDVTSPLFHLLIDDGSIFSNPLFDFDNDEHEFVNKPGTGNAKSGQRQPYHLYPPSPVFSELSIKDNVWHNFVPFDVDDFLDICHECYADWILPRNGSNIIRPRKHGIESSLIGTFAILTKNHTFLSGEGLSKVDDALIYLDFEHNLKVLEKVLDYEMQWPDANERMLLCNLCENFNAPILLDCTDCKLLQTNDPICNEMFYSWKCTQAWRNMIVCDTKGEIRATASVPAGWANDQTLLRCCEFFQNGRLSPHETCLGDGGFTGNNNFPIDRPFTEPQVANNPRLEAYNRALRDFRRLIERINGILKAMFRILHIEFRMKRHLFPLVFKVCCLLLNRYFRLYGYPVRSR